MERKEIMWKAGTLAAMAGISTLVIFSMKSDITKKRREYAEINRTAIMVADVPMRWGIPIKQQYRLAGFDADEEQGIDRIVKYRSRTGGSPRVIYDEDHPEFERYLGELEEYRVEALSFP